MKKLFKKNTEHCCELMQEYLDEKKVGIYYDPIIRGYSICLIGLKNGKHVIYNCPWCGYKFLPSLIDKYCNILENEYNLYYNSFSETYYDIIKDEIVREVPEEFKSDEWWKKRNL